MFGILCTNHKNTVGAKGDEERGEVILSCFVFYTRACKSNAPVINELLKLNKTWDKYL